MGSVLRFTAAFGLVCAGLLAGGVLLGLDPVAIRTPDEVRAAEVEVREERSEDAKKLKVRIEEAKKKIEKTLRKEFDRRLKEREKEFTKKLSQVSGINEEVARQAAELVRREEDLSKEKERLNDKVQKVAELEEKIHRRETEAEKKEKEAQDRRKKMANLEARLREREKKTGDKETELADMARTLLDQQARMKATEERTAKDQAEKDRQQRTREEEMREMAKTLKDQQAAIAEKQKALRDVQETNRLELRKVQDAYKRNKAREAELDKKLAQASSSLADLEKLKAERKLLAEERKKLDETVDVRQNVKAYRQSFDERAYAAKLSELMRATGLKTVESRFIPFHFYSANDETQKNQLRYFGIRDVYMNMKSKKYVVMSDYASGDFSSSGVWGDDELGQKFPSYSIVVLERRTHKGFYRETLAKALGRVGGAARGVYVFGLMTKVMVYEVFLHQKRVMELLGLERRQIVKFKFAPFFHQGRWRFKVLNVTTRESSGAETVRPVGNYSFTP